jgi:hypothetical protein
VPAQPARAVRLALFGLAATATFLITALLAFSQPGAPAAPRALAAPEVSGGPVPTARPPSPDPAGVAVGRRFLALYARYHGAPLNARARRSLRRLATLELADQLLSQPPPASRRQPQLRPRSLRAIRRSGELVVISAVLATGGARVRVSCRVARAERRRWVVTDLFLLS